MRVAFIDQVGDDAGGAQESLALLLAHLPPDIEARVVLFGDGRYANRLRTAGHSVHVLSIANAIARSTRERPSLSGALAIPRAVAALAAYLRQEQVHLVHTNSVKAHVVGGPAARLARRPAVAHFRDILQGRGRAIVRSIAAACSTERIAISAAVARAYGLDRTTVVENPLDLESFAALPERSAARSQLGLPADIPIAAIVGRINRWKGHDRFLRAAASVAAQGNAHFVIAGSARFRDADFVPELHALVETLGLGGRVTFVDWLDDPRILYAAIDLHVNASTQEPFGRTVIEAAAAGVPTVCFDDAGVAEFMDQSMGRVVPAGSEAALAREMQWYLNDSSARAQAGAAARAWSQRFDARRHAARIATILLHAA